MKYLAGKQTIPWARRGRRSEALRQEIGVPEKRLRWFLTFFTTGQMTLFMPIISVCCDRKLEFYLAVLAPNDNLALCQLIVWISSSEHVVVGHVGAVDLNTLLQNLLFVLGGNSSENQPKWICVPIKAAHLNFSPTGWQRRNSIPKNKFDRRDSSWRVLDLQVRSSNANELFLDLRK